MPLALYPQKRNADRKQPRFQRILSDSREISRSSVSSHLTGNHPVLFQRKNAHGGTVPLYGHFTFYRLFIGGLCAHSHLFSRLSLYALITLLVIEGPCVRIMLCAVVHPVIGALICRALSADRTGVRASGSG